MNLQLVFMGSVVIYQSCAKSVNLMEGIWELGTVAGCGRTREEPGRRGAEQLMQAWHSHSSICIKHKTPGADVMKAPTHSMGIQHHCRTAYGGIFTESE